MSTANRTVPVDGIGPVEVTIAEYGSGQPFLLLHGAPSAGSPSCSPPPTTCAYSSRPTPASAARRDPRP